jgi:hypothetical protein
MDSIKISFRCLKNKIKYGFESSKIRNNFSSWNFSKFGVEFELKSGKVLGVKFE